MDRGAQYINAQSGNPSFRDPGNRFPGESSMISGFIFLRKRELMSKCKGYAASTAKAPLGPYSFERREPGEHDVVIDIKYCGICHSDIHQARDEWSDYQDECIFPMVPGHE